MRLAGLGFSAITFDFLVPQPRSRGAKFSTGGAPKLSRQVRFEATPAIR